MREIRGFSIGDWIVTENGIGQVIGSQAYAVQEFFKDDYPTLNCGDIFDNIVVYKILCDFDGKPRKTKFFTYISSQFCDPIDANNLKIKDRVKASYSDAYETFLKRKPKRHVESSIDLTFRVIPKYKEGVIVQIQDILDTMPKPFDFKTFERSALKQVCGIESDGISGFKDTLMSNAMISLKYNILDANVFNFSFVDGICVPVYCAYDKQ